MEKGENGRFGASALVGLTRVKDANDHYSSIYEVALASELSDLHQMQKVVSKSPTLEQRGFCQNELQPTVV